MLDRATATHFDIMLCGDHACLRCAAPLPRGETVALIFDVAPGGEELELFHALCLSCHGGTPSGTVAVSPSMGAAAAVLRVALANLGRGAVYQRACSAYLVIGSA